MSQRKRSRALRLSQQSDPEEQLSPSSASPHSQGLWTLDKHCPERLSQKVSELVQFLLVKDQKKIPIKRADILKNVVRECRELYPEVFRRAGKTLQEVFGLQLVELDPRQHSYILTSCLPPDGAEGLWGDPQRAKLGLLMVILSFIFMKGNSAKDTALWEFLRRLRLYPGEHHEVFGDPRKVVAEEFVRQKYLEVSPIPLTDPPESNFRWGPRAARETSKGAVLRFVAKIQGKDPKFWLSQYNEAEAAQH